VANRSSGSQTRAAVRFQVLEDCVVAVAVVLEDLCVDVELLTT